MARYRGPTCKLCRREGEQLFLKGARCYTSKCAARLNQGPGVHGASIGRSRLSDYGIRLREKQKVKRIYGLTEKQFRRYFTEAARRSGVTGAMLITLLERRLDNVVYRLGFGSSRSEARHLVWLGHVLVDGKRVNIPSFSVEQGNKIEIKAKTRDNPHVNQSLEGLERRGFPQWLELDRENYSGVVTRLPEREDVTIPIDEQLIVEFYSRV